MVFHDAFPHIAANRIWKHQPTSANISHLIPTHPWPPVQVATVDSVVVPFCFSVGTFSSTAIRPLLFSFVKPGSIACLPPRNSGEFGWNAGSEWSNGWDAANTLSGSQKLPTKESWHNSNMSQPGSTRLTLRLS